MQFSEDEFDQNNVGNPRSGSTMSKADLRKTNKPIMEKKRRARINNCLNELKDLLMESMKADPARHSKLEKADILELTVKHLQTIQRQHLAAAVAADPAVLMRFRAGFGDCANEVKRYLSRMGGVPSGLRGRLGTYLSTCVGGLDEVGHLPHNEFPTFPPPTQKSFEDGDLAMRRNSAFHFVRKPVSPPMSPVSCDSACDSSTELDISEISTPIVPLSRTFPTPPSKDNSDQEPSPETQRQTVSSTTISPDSVQKPAVAIVIDVENYKMKIDTTPVRPVDYCMNIRKRHLNDVNIPVPIKVQVISHTDHAKAGSSHGSSTSAHDKADADTSSSSPESSKPNEGVWRPW